MNCKPNLYISWLLIILSTLCVSLNAQEIADPNYYLVDNLYLSNIAQEDRTLIDSALVLYYASQNDTLKINALNIIVDNCYDNNVWPEYNLLVLNFTKKKLADSSSLEDKEKRSLKIKLSGAINNMGYHYMLKGDMVNAMKLYLESLEMQKKIGDHAGLADSFNNIGLIHHLQGELEMALEFFYQSVTLEEQAKDLQGMATTYNNIGVILDNLGDKTKAFTFHLKCLEIKKSLGDKHGIAFSNSNIGVYYHSLAKREKLASKKRDSLIELSLYHHKQSLTLRMDIGEKEGQCNSLANIGEIELESGHDSIAEVYGKQGLAFALKLGFPSQIQRSAKLLSKVAKKQKDWIKALQMKEMEVQFGDSLTNIENQKASIRQQTQYKFEKERILKEQEIKESDRILRHKIQRRNNLQYSIIFIGILLVFGGVLSLDFVKVSPHIADGLIFFAFLILFEFVLVLSDPYVDQWTGGAPGWKLMINAATAALIFPVHGFFEKLLKGRLVKKNNRTENGR